MNTDPFIILITALLIILWLYASLSKLFHFSNFKDSMSIQAFPAWLGKILTIVLPVIELTIVALLMVPATRLAGMCCSFLLMCMFTLYIAGAVFKLYRRMPCACGGLFNKLNWREHLNVNIILTIISLAGILCELYLEPGI
ncbi:MauE/DoxX family redox-associated membrane protein [Mucilaginibacter sp. UR6-11]|uniref:MauE/DoxX family redox-associated membrane protein n=1 Tax=Mucilaginibacter sp. UR6-11 TaxID=1435644 RepID=UPI00351D0886